MRDLSHNNKSRKDEYGKNAESLNQIKDIHDKKINQ